MVGQRSAEGLRKRLAIPVKIEMPGKRGTDWNDVLVRG